MAKTLHTDTAPAPFSNYSQAVEVPAGSRVMFVSGQVGVDNDGNLAADERGQHDQCWRNILAILAAQDLGPEHIVDVTVYVTQASGVPISRVARDAVLNGAKPCSTLLMISGLANPDWLVEISVVAAGPATG